VDGLSGLFDTPQQPQPPQQQQHQGIIRSGPVGGAMGSGRSIPTRGAVSSRGRPPPPTASATTTPSQAKIPTPQQKQKQLQISGQSIAVLNQLESDILSVIKSFPKPNVANDTGEEEDEDEDDILLILDQPDLILATTPGIDANDMSEWVTGLQQVCPLLLPFFFPDQGTDNILVKACSFNDNNHRRGLPAHPQCKYLYYDGNYVRRNTPGEKPCLFRRWIGASRGYGVTVTDAGYGGGEGCEWCFEDE
jgi:hypothetical protein